MTTLSQDQGISATNRLLITIAIMSATIMQTLDMTIVNVALPYMQGSLDTTPDRITWILTSYMVASAIVMPLTGYFSDRLGRKSHLLWCIGGFTITSAFCGVAGSLAQMVGFRLLQGVFGAALVPLSQAIITDVYPRKDMGKAIALWGAGVMLGPVLGPTLGGYLTDIANWRWTFYINIPVGIMAFLLAWRVVPNTSKKERSFDWIGFILIAIAVGSIQYFLDRGNQDDWFNATSIQISALLAIVGLIGFFVYSYFHSGEHCQAIFNFRIFKDRNFIIASLLLAVLGIGVFGSMAIFPLLLENLLNYPVLTAGMMMSPRAICVMISMFTIGRICHRFDPRKLVALGLLTGAIGTYACTYYPFEPNTWWLIWPSMVQGLGLGMIFIPLGTTAFSTLPVELRAEAAGLNSLLRTVGGSIGIATTITMFTRHSRIAWDQLVGFVNPYNPNLTEYLNQVNLQPAAIPVLLSGELAKQAAMLSMINVFIFITYSFLVMLPLILVLKHTKNTVSIQHNLK